MPILSPIQGLYPSIEEVFNSTRVHLNDTFSGATGTPGEGRIFVDTFSPTITILNLALARFKRDLEHYGVSTTREEVFLIKTPVLNGPNGPGVPDPTIQQYMNFEGFFDGANLDNTKGLPFDMMIPLKIEERISGSGSNFQTLDECPDGLYSFLQNVSMGNWEWRQDALFFNGSISSMDLRIRYTADLPRYPLTLSPTKPPNPGAPWFGNTLIPFLDSMEPLSYLCAFIFSEPRVMPGEVKALEEHYEEAMLKIANREIKTRQRVPIEREQFGFEGDYFGW